MPPNPDPDPALGAAVRQLRADADLTQEELADRIAMHVMTVRRIETGKSDPTVGTVRRIAAALGTEGSRVLALAEEIRKARDSR